MDDLERELDGDKPTKSKFKLPRPGKCSNDVVFSNNSNSRKPGDIGRQAAQYDKPKLLTTEKQVLEERLRRLKDKEFMEGGK